VNDVMKLPDGVAALIPKFLVRQRWFAGTEVPQDVAVVAVEEVASHGGHRLLRAVVRSGGNRYQLLIGERPNGEAAEFLKGREGSVLGQAGSSYYYDGVLDPELALALLEVVTKGEQKAVRMRPITVEQSNTSLVYDDRIILKVFRRLLDGRNPDVEVTTALFAAGFDHVATPIAAWDDGVEDLAFAQQYLAGGSDGWALALTSLRDLYNDQSSDPAEAGGDFAGEARRLGRITAQMHLAMAAAFGVERRSLAEQWWPAMIASIDERLREATATIGGGLGEAGASFVEALREVTEPGPAVRVHGDYHLGQVMWTDAGWYVLDFEGEPARPLAERTRPSSPLKDVTGMLRSFHYASRAALWDRDDEEAATLEPVAEAWELRNRAAFLEAYRSTPSIAPLVPEDEPAWTLVLAAYEMDKALYELAYEHVYRPDWAAIPLHAVVRILERS
jgi:maltokinase